MHGVSRGENQWETPADGSLLLLGGFRAPAVPARFTVSRTSCTFTLTQVPEDIRRLALTILCSQALYFVQPSWLRGHEKLQSESF